MTLKVSTLQTLINEIINKYHATCVEKKQQSILFENEDKCISLDIYIYGVTVDTLIKMNLDLISKISEKNIDSGNIAPLFILSDKKSTAVLGTTIQRNQEHCHGRNK